MTTKINFNALDDSIFASQNDAEAGIADDVLMTPQRTSQSISALVNRLGEIVDWPFTTIPTSKKALFCNGQTIGNVGSGATFESSDYEDLFELLKAEGTKYGNTGTENWSSGHTIKLPDRRGYVPAGKDNMGGASSASRLTGLSGGVDGSTLGATGGSQTHTLTINEIPPHTHTTPVQNDSTVGGTNLPRGSTSTTPVGNITSSSSGGGTAHNNIQPTVITNFIIFYI